MLTVGTQKWDIMCDKSLMNEEHTHYENPTIEPPRFNDYTVRPPLYERSGFELQGYSRTYLLMLEKTDSKTFTGALLVAAIILLAGCSTTIMPKSVPPIKGLETGSLAGMSLSIKNIETDSREYAILNSSGQNTGFVTNRQAWSVMLVEALATELSKRGAQVRLNAPVTVSIGLPEIKVNQSRGIYQSSIKVSVSLSTGWSKKYEAVADSDPGPFEKLATTVRNASSQTLGEAVKAILGDAEFLYQLKKKEPLAH